MKAGVSMKRNVPIVQDFPPNMDKYLSDSQRRCELIGVRTTQISAKYQLKRWETNELLKRERHFLSICESCLNLCRPSMEMSDFVMGISDRNGILLRVYGEGDFGGKLHHLGFKASVDWSERSAGTNGLGTALSLGMPIHVAGKNHFCHCFDEYDSTGIPLYDGGQRILGVLCLMTPSNSKTYPYVLSMLRAASLTIQKELNAQVLKQEIHIISSYRDSVLHTSYSPVLIVDHLGRLMDINQPATQLLHLPPHNVCVGNPLLDFLPEGNDDLNQIISNGVHIAGTPIVIHTPGQETRCRINISSIAPTERHGGGMVLSFDVIDSTASNKKAQEKIAEYKTFSNLIGRNPRFVEQVALAKNAALTDANVLLLGESGTGKDVLAQAIHSYSGRAHNTFTAINCSALPRELIASELFGYVDGAFTGARKGGASGKFEYANGGTIFLDEIGDMPLDLQGHLLRLIEDRKVQRIGSNKPVSLDVRIIAATNQDLQKAIQNGTFRQDLYYRLNVITIHTIPLRERLDDLEELAYYFYMGLTKNLHVPAVPISDTFIQVLRKYNFPGNIRELRNIVERSIAMYPGKVLDASCVPFDLFFNQAAPAALNPVIETPYPLKTETAEFGGESSEKMRVYRLLMKNNGNVSKTAQEMGIARTTLYRKMDRYGLSKTFKL